MYICICSSITDTDIKHAIENGVRNVRDLNQELCVGGTCRKGIRATRQVINSHLGEESISHSISNA